MSRGSYGRLESIVQRAKRADASELARCRCEACRECAFSRQLVEVFDLDGDGIVLQAVGCIVRAHACATRDDAAFCVTNRNTKACYVQARTR